MSHPASNRIRLAALLSSLRHTSTLQLPMPDFLLEMKQRAQRILDRLDGAPLVDLCCVVGAAGAGAGQMRGESDWTLTFTSPAWRIDGQTVSTGKMTLRRRLRQHEIAPLQAILAPLTIVRLRARWVEDADIGGAQALVVGVPTGPIADPDLAAVAEALRRPVVVDDQILGSLTLDRRIRSFQGRAAFCGRDVRVSLDAETDTAMHKALAHAHSIWRDQVRWQRDAVASAVAGLLETMNDNWLPEDESELSGEEFGERLTLEDISVDEDGSLSFWFGDGDMFAGHSVCVTGSIAEGFDHAEIAG